MHTKKELDERIKKAGIRPLKSLGQNFLVNPAIAAKFMSAVQALNPRFVVEIGPGLGALTDDLVLGSWTTCLVELDAGLVEYWKAAGVSVVHKDALHVDWSELLENLKAEKPALLTGNLPYGIAASLVVELSGAAETPQPFDAMILMFQKEVAQRITAHPHDEDYGMLSVVAQTAWTIGLVVDAGPQDFHPVPHVGSRVLKFTRRANDALAPESAGSFVDFVKLAFSQRRKKLASNLGGRYGKETAEARIGEMGFPSDVRAQALSPERFMRLFSDLEARKK